MSAHLIKGKNFDKPTNYLLNRLAAYSSNYWFGFISDPATALFCLFWDALVLRSSAYSIVAFFVLGLFAWSLLEYGFHRWVYHKGRTIAHAGHLMHHESPRALIGMPWFMSTGFLWGFWYVFAHRLQVHGSLSFIAGLDTGFMLYSLLHHIHHHSSASKSRFRKLRAHHNIHHRLPHVNFGVTTRLWDRIFGTMHVKGKARTVSQPR
jgi:sterol desaturase/sphingolipid hydroxylase (fatty acid hydroxylase superfamily)